MKPTNATTMMSGPGVVSASANLVAHLKLGQPVQLSDGYLCNIRDHGIGSANRHKSSFREKQRERFPEREVAGDEIEVRQRRKPQGQSNGRQLQRPPEQSRTVLLWQRASRSTIIFSWPLLHPDW